MSLLLKKYNVKGVFYKHYYRDCLVGQFITRRAFRLVYNCKFGLDANLARFNSACRHFDWKPQTLKPAKFY